MASKAVPDIEDAEKVLSELKEKTIIVEGKKDAKALMGLGLMDVVPINGRPLVDVVQGLKTKDVTILTDFDREGKRINSRLISLLQRFGVKTNPRLRRMFGSLGKTRIEDFNGIGMEMKGMAESLKKEGDSYGEISASIDKIPDKSKDKGKGSNRKTRRDRSCFWSDRRSARQ